MPNNSSREPLNMPLKKGYYFIQQLKNNTRRLDRDINSLFYSSKCFPYIIIVPCRDYLVMVIGLHCQRGILTKQMGRMYIPRSKIERAPAPILKILHDPRYLIPKKGTIVYEGHAGFYFSICSMSRMRGLMWAHAFLDPGTTLRKP